MTIYLVEEMRNDRAIRSRAIDAPTPLLAALELTDRKISLRTWERDWVRVTDEVRGKVFAYSIGDKGAPKTEASRRKKPTPA
ncbi:hypothetical protein C7I87_20665 [Mesorhizobium sp. SARCC-RB16n]|uniref:hypothetical protein n=1 Tax=Mesorhizobium sp. SARCC-RB16n TaxID=2116687 RepID=UPI00122F7FAD|nr:hypothetical protein [Mesorhizobium sp. SARCC-RB16n]KAA3448794.1 hypothetical protein C7I87_20665 [Mesorhizobium sp. SARCC-RB16n]